jgi:hypothetical protein
MKEPAKPALSKGQVKVLTCHVTVYVEMYQLCDRKASEFLCVFSAPLGLCFFCTARMAAIWKRIGRLRPEMDRTVWTEQNAGLSKLPPG